MLPDEAADPAVLWDCLEGAVGSLVSRCRTMNGDIVDVGDRVLGNLRLKDVHYIVVEDGDSVSPTHWEFCETQGAVWGLESGVVAGCLSESAFVISNIQVEHSSTGMTCELLSNLFGEGVTPECWIVTALRGSRLWMGQVASASFFAMQNQ